MKTWRTTSWTTAFSLVIAAGGSLAIAQPPGEQLIDQVTQAYQDIQQYDATLRFEMSQTQGRWTMSQAADFHIALDGAGSTEFAGQALAGSTFDGQGATQFAGEGTLGINWVVPPETDVDAMDMERDDKPFDAERDDKPFDMER